MNSVSNRFGNKQLWLLVLGLGFIIGAYFFLSYQPGIPIVSAARAPRPAQPASVPGGEQTPQYNRLQTTADGQRADVAMVNGGSAMPSPPTLQAFVLGQPEPEPSPAAEAPPAPKAPAAPAAAKPANATQDDALARAMQQQFKQLLAYREARFAPKPTRVTLHSDIKGLEAAQALAQAAAKNQQPPPATLPHDAYGSLKPGDILHAVLQTAINSDEPGPIRARIVGKRFKGAILLGKLTRFPPVQGNRPERVLVQFTYMTTVSGQVYELDSYAIDPETTRTALASDVNHHYLSRWGALIAASFLEGYGEAVRASNTITTVGPLGTVVTTPKDDIDDEDIAREAAGTVGLRLADAVGQHFNRPNTIRVDSGSGIGVLIVSPGQSQNQVAEITLDNVAPFGSPAQLPIRTRYDPPSAYRQYPPQAMNPQRPSEQLEP